MVVMDHNLAYLKEFDNYEGTWCELAYEYTDQWIYY